MLPKDDDGWIPCAEGALLAMLEQARAERRQSNLLRLVVSALALLFASFYFAPSAIDRDSINLECRDVGSLLAGYVAGDLDQASLQVVEQHLVSCEKCRAKLGQMQAGEMAMLKALSLPAPTFQEDLLLTAIQPMPLAID